MHFNLPAGILNTLAAPQLKTKKLPGQISGDLFAKLMWCASCCPLPISGFFDPFFCLNIAAHASPVDEHFRQEGLFCTRDAHKAEDGFSRPNDGTTNLAQHHTTQQIQSIAGPWRREQNRFFRTRYTCVFCAMTECASYMERQTVEPNVF